MLYNPQWQPTKWQPTEFSMNGLIAWLEQQPPDKSYRYLSYDTCLAARFNESCGRNYEVPNPFAFWRYHKFENKLEYSIAGIRPYTYGAALERARIIANK